MALRGHLPHPRFTTPLPATHGATSGTFCNFFRDISPVVSNLCSEPISVVVGTNTDVRRRRAEEVMCLPRSRAAHRRRHAIWGDTTMTDPRMMIPGQTAHIIRRCRQGQFLLKPTEYTTSVVKYEIAKAASKTDQAISGATFMSNHYHLMTLDMNASRSAFVGNLNREITRRLKKHLSLSRGIWAQERFKDIQVGDAQRELETLVYIWTNPVKDGLVARVEDWPGFQVLPQHWGEEITVKRPSKHYGKGCPETVSFTPQPPACLRHLPLERAIAKCQQLIHQKEEEYRLQRLETCKEILGRNAVLTVCPTDVPDSDFQPAGAATGFSYSSPDAEKAAEDRYRQFKDQYETQRQRWQAGQVATFPCGTLHLRLNASIDCHPPPSDLPGIYREDPDDEAQAPADSSHLG